MRTILRGGPYFRVADPDWSEPLSGVYAQRRGGRWNPPDSFPVVYLSRTVATARLNARRVLHERTLTGMPFSFDDLEPSSLPCLIETIVPEAGAADCVTARGLISAGLPKTYPRDDTGATVTWETCQPVGAAAHSEGLPGVAARSAAPGASADDEELAWFPDRGGELLPATNAEPFVQWFGDY